MSFFETNSVSYKRNVLIVPNYTHFGKDKNINADSFILVLRSYLEHKNDLETRFVLPYPDDNIPYCLCKFENVKLVNMGNISTFPQMMRISFPENFFKNLFTEYEFDHIWCHLPEWLNSLLVCRRYTKTTQTITGYCHWYELPENNCYNHNTFINNIQGTLKMKKCGVNSLWIKNLVLKRSSEIFNQNIIDKLNDIITPMYLGCDKHKHTDNINKKTILFNHRNDNYTGADWFFDEMDKLYEQRKDFAVYTTISDLNKPYIINIKHPDREIYLNNISKAYVGVGCFTKYSAWSMSTTDGLSRNVPYILPKGLCYEEMVGSDYPLLYSNKQEFLKLLTNALDEKIERINTKEISDKLSWSNSLNNWTTI